MTYTFSNQQTRRVSRTQARRVRCPECFAEPGNPCFGVREERRISCHAERHEAYLRWQAAAELIPAQLKTREWRPTATDKRLLYRCAGCPDWRSPAGLVDGLCNECRREAAGKPRWVGSSTLEVFAIACPDCQAPPARPCMGSPRPDGGRAPIASHHSARWRAANEAFGYEV